MVPSDIVHALSDLVQILKDGGPYAGWGLFILLFYYERRDNKNMRKEFTALSVAQVENNVKTELTLSSLKEAMNSLHSSTKGVENILNKIFTLKETLITMTSTSNKEHGE